VLLARVVAVVVASKQHYSSLFISLHAKLIMSRSQASSKQAAKSRQKQKQAATRLASSTTHKEHGN